MPDIFSYTNYRDLIKDYHEEQKRTRSSFSYQIFAQKAGFSTKTYIIEVVSGKKKLSKGSLFNVAKAMNLNKKETDYFEALVNFNHAKKLKEREFYFDRLKSLSGKSSAKMIGSSQYAFFSEWYHLVVRELVAMTDFNGDFNQLARKVKPRITAKQAKDSVKLLLDLGMIQKTASGKYKLTESTLSTGDELTSLAVLQHQKKTLELGIEALEKFPTEMRDISTVSAGISEKGFRTIKKEIQLFRKHLQGLIEQDKDLDRVYQINFQLFPLTEIPKKE